MTKFFIDEEKGQIVQANVRSVRHTGHNNNMILYSFNGIDKEIPDLLVFDTKDDAKKSYLDKLTFLIKHFEDQITQAQKYINEYKQKIEKL